MILNYLAFAVPLFLTFIGIEYLVAKAQKKDYFKFGNSVANLNVGIAERLLDTFTVGIFYFFYDYLHTNFALFDIKPSATLWIILLIATDFIWYWYHRLAHEVNILWSVHVVHHQSEDFNYTVSARITVFQALVRTLFWSGLPIIGFPAEMITTILLVHGAYPFFIHTQTIGKLGILEYIIVTPSHHRVHHASNEIYLDKNYGDILIIWDKIFGTFAKEVAEKPVFGLTKPLESHSFLWQHFHFLLELIYAVRQTSGLKNKLKILFGKPDNVPVTLRDTLESKFLSHKRRTPASKRFKNYVTWQLACVLILLFVFLLLEHYFSITAQILLSIIILTTLVNCGAILEQKTWIFYLEYVRLAGIFFMLFGFTPILSILFILGLGLLIYNFSVLEKYYLQLVYGNLIEIVEN